MNKIRLGIFPMGPTTKNEVYYIQYTHTQILRLPNNTVSLLPFLLKVLENLGAWGL